MKHLLLTLAVAGLAPCLVNAAEPKERVAEPTFTEWHDLSVNNVNRFATRTSFFAYENREAALKGNRDRQKSLGLISYAQLYSEYDANRPANKISVMGNPTLGEVRTIMIGVRNNSRHARSVEVWANELRLQEFSNNGGWAARGALILQLSDLASVNLTGHVETEGF